jgi:hypothetical protein
MSYKKHYNNRYNDAEAELRDIFAAVAMIGLMNDKTATPKWVANQAYKYADAMLDVREDSGNSPSLINEKKTETTNT